MKYPKTLTKEELANWFETSRLPLELLVIQTSEDSVTMYKLNLKEVPQR
jgi:hypothetical protein